MPSFSTILMFVLQTLLCLSSSLHAQVGVTGQSQVNLLERFDYETVSSAYAFILGQDLVLERIEAKYPYLATEVNSVRHSFDAAFGKARRVAKDQMELLLGNEFQRVKRELEAQSMVVLSQYLASPEQAMALLEEYQNRTKGVIDSPFLEFLLALHYCDEPHQELTSGFKQRYSSENHPKAKGMHVSLNLPHSWVKEEADRPNIVAKFRSRLGYSHGTILFGVLDMDFPPELTVTKQDLVELFTEEFISSMMPDGMKKVSARPITVENLPAGELICEGWLSNVGFSVYTKMYMVFVIYDGKMIMYQSGVSNMSPEGVAEAFDANRMLFNLVSSTLVIHNRWR